MQKGINLEDIEDRQYFFDEFIAETCALSVVPLGSFEYVVSRLRTRNYFPSNELG